jgi:hypothetical protein
MEKPELKAVYYGQVKLIPGISCDGYILNDGTAVMSENGTASLLGMEQQSLNAITVNGLPKTLQPFIDKDVTITVNLAEVVAKNSPYQGRKIVVYRSKDIESLIITYALAFAKDALRENQKHIGQRCVFLLTALVKTALEAAIQEACGVVPEIQKSVQRYYTDAIFDFERGVLLNALQQAYPKREEKKYKGLIAHCFNYCYQDVLGIDAWKKIKQGKEKRFPIHQYIETEEKRKMCITYINTLAAQTLVKKCKVAESRQATRKLLKKCLQNQQQSFGF